MRQRRQIAGAVAVVLVGLGAGAIALLGGGDDAPAEPDPTEYLAELSEARVATWDRLAECESEGQWDLVTGNGFEGGLQFTRSSWAEVGGQGSPAAASRAEQIMRAELLYELQGWSAWPGCSARLGFAGP